MKTLLTNSIAIAFLVFADVGFAGGLAKPVGFFTLSVRGEGFSLLSPGLLNPIEFEDETLANSFEKGTGTLTFPGTPFVGVDLGSVDAVMGKSGVATSAFIPYYVEVTSGPEAGAWANILSNGANTLTVDRDLSAAGNERVVIRRHVTIADLFGANNEAGLDGDEQGEISNADEVILFSEGVARVFFYVTAPDLAGWYDASLVRADKTEIEPQQAVYVNRKVAGDIEFIRAGYVKVGPTKLAIHPGFNAVANPRAVGVDDQGNPVFTLGNCNLWNGDSANRVDASEDGNLSKADQIIIFNDPGHPEGLFSVYFYVEVKGFAGWYDATLGAC